MQFFTVHSSIVKTRCLNAISHGLLHIGRIRRVIISREVWFWYHGGNHFHSENSKFWQCASGVNPKSCRLCVLSFFAIQNAITPWLWGVSVASVTSRFSSAQGQYNKHRPIHQVRPFVQEIVWARSYRAIRSSYFFSYTLLLLPVIYL